MKLHRLILVLAIGLFLYGDVMYEMITTTQGMMGMGGSEIMTRVFIKGDCSRSEMTTKSPAGEINVISITRLDKGLIWQLDPANQSYTETKLGVEEKVEEGKEETEVVIPEIKVEETGKGMKILKHNCKEVIVSMSAKSEQGEVTFTQTMWVSEDIPCYKEIREYAKKLRSMSSGLSQSAIPIDKKLIDEFQKKIGEVEGFPLKMDLDMTMGAEEMQFSINNQSTVTKIQTNPINKNVFEIPKGYTLRE